MLGRGAIHHICRQAHPAKLFRDIAIPRNAEGPTPGNGCECEQQGSRPAGSTTEQHKRGSWRPLPTTDRAHVRLFLEAALAYAFLRRILRRD
jgi:hypothetical protein